eukprot:TRINITY_DN30898_c0_g1_i1.p1 TRINITY_DN30898_c0_g1~~TRINITY_DN30898_c0_g1_i1.p1  ORF type:complete len:333 (+),score=74.51 TRINITY_DN30898_c0_g1_i1:57-1001(+)
MEQWAVDPHAEMAKRGWSMIKESPGEGYADITGCKGAWKKTLEEGEGDEKPREGSFTNIQYWYRYKGEVFDSTDKEGDLEIIPGSGMSTAGMEEGVVTMKKGERAVFILDPIFGFKENGFPPKVPEWAVIELEIKLVEFMGPWTDEEKVQVGIDFKTEGNSLFKAGEYKAAIKKYNRGLDVLGRRRRKLRPSLKEAEEAQHAIRLTLLQNIMQSWFKFGNTERGLDYVENLLRQDPTNTKARFRKARFELGRHNYYQARDHLQIIKDNNPDPAVQTEIANEFNKILKEEQLSKQKEKNTAKKASAGIFGSPDTP